MAEAPDPQPQDGEALIRIEASAVCGSERTTLIAGSGTNGGHEACGTVIEPGTSDFAAGARVGLAAIVGCGRCDRCRSGQELHCRRGPRSVGGGWHAELAAVPPSALRPLPKNTDAGVGALLTGDALGVPARGVRRAAPEPRDRILVIGLGPVGLGHVLVRSFLGAEVIGLEPASYRRDQALRLGASAVFADASEIEGRPRLVIECTGIVSCIEQALDLVDNGGVVLQSGECSRPVQINPSDLLIRREITYTGAWYYASEDYPGMCDLLARGLPLEAMCTHDVPAAAAQTAITEFLDGRTAKVVLRWT